MQKTPNNELNRLTINDFKTSQKLPIVIVLDNIRSANNVGSVFRTADSFLLQSIYLCGITACPPNKEVYKTALGATETVDWEYFNNTQQALNTLIEQNYTLIAVEQVQNSTYLQHFTINKNTKYALIFGHEVDGVNQEIILQCSQSIEIPQLGTKHSLNIAVSVGIVIWEFSKQLIAIK